jgi:hypothetical protein
MTKLLRTLPQRNQDFFHEQKNLILKNGTENWGEDLGCAVATRTEFVTPQLLCE